MWRWWTCAHLSRVAQVLHKIWALVDVKQEGRIDADFFAVAMHLTMKTKQGEPLPDVLPPEFVPPAHRQ